MVCVSVGAGAGALGGGAAAWLYWRDPDYVDASPITLPPGTWEALIQLDTRPVGKPVPVPEPASLLGLPTAIALMLVAGRVHAWIRRRHRT